MSYTKGINRAHGINHTLVSKKEECKNVEWIKGYKGSTRMKSRETIIKKWSKCFMAVDYHKSVPYSWFLTEYSHLWDVYSLLLDEWTQPYLDLRHLL